jgi:hypothetical protein
VAAGALWEEGIMMHCNQCLVITQILYNPYLSQWTQPNTMHISSKLTPWPWRWRWYVPLKRHAPSELHGVISQKAAFFVRTVERMSNQTSCMLLRLFCLTSNKIWHWLYIPPSFSDEHQDNTVTFKVRTHDAAMLALWNYRQPQLKLQES